jgi:hypothetical protein
VKMSERDTNTEEKHKEPRAWRPWIPLRRQPWRWVLWAVMLVIALVTLGWLVVILYPDIWQEITRKRVATLIGIGVALTVIIVLLAKGSASLGWTGFRGKTLWDLLQLLIVPLVLVGIGLLFEMQQAAREDQRAAVERELAEQRAQDEALQAYLDQMSQLMLERKLLEAELGDPVHTLAQARTSTVMLSLDAEHNESVTRFLSDSGLTGSGEASARLLDDISLSHATLSDADLSSAEGITNEELEQQSASLKGATMPNGLKYEDWLKSRSRGADGENSAPS